MTISRTPNTGEGNKRLLPTLYPLPVVAYPMHLSAALACLNRT